jgi:hypothetical protein
MKNQSNEKGQTEFAYNHHQHGYLVIYQQIDLSPSQAWFLSHHFLGGLRLIKAAVTLSRHCCFTPKTEMSHQWLSL